MKREEFDLIAADVKREVTQLNELSTDQLVALLRAERITGTPGSCDRCPLAVLINQQARVTERGVRIGVISPRVDVWVYEVEFRFSDVTLLSGALTSFVTAFDNASEDVREFADPGWSVSWDDEFAEHVWEYVGEEVTP